mmetsp:Transcript_17611/g.29738  ORF Transcript_17611/g.29738 Transcript_17611/m.29738 type:complete len:189 (-) Transcript_17611:275-841(-)
MVHDKVPHVPIVKEYEHALIRKNPTLNTAKLCEALYQVLLRKSNVSVKFNSYVAGYNLVESGERKGNVRSLLLNFENELNVDEVVICTGPFAIAHLRDHFDICLPMITAQGYTVDLPEVSKDLDKDVHVKIGDKGFAYAQIEPGKHRIVAFMDFGIFDKAFIDQKRKDHLYRLFKECFDLEPFKLSKE